MVGEGTPQQWTNWSWVNPGIPTTLKTMGNITTIAYLRVLIIEIGSTIILMVGEAQGEAIFYLSMQ